MNAPDNSDVFVLPDGSGAAMMSLPLPKNHWLFAKTADGYTPPPPMGLRCSPDAPYDARYRAVLTRHLINAVRYGVKCATINGTMENFDPDALVQQTIVGLFGYHTPNGLSLDAWANPDPIPAGLHAVLTTLMGGRVDMAPLFCEPERADEVVTSADKSEVADES